MATSVCIRVTGCGRVPVHGKLLFEDMSVLREWVYDAFVYDAFVYDAIDPSNQFTARHWNEFGHKQPVYECSDTTRLLRNQRLMHLPCMRLMRNWPGLQFQMLERYDPHANTARPAQTSRHVTHDTPCYW